MHRLILGTHTSGEATDYLQIVHVKLPKPPAARIDDYNSSTEELGGHGAAKHPIEFSVVQKIVHPGEVNKARYQPQNPDIIATWAPNKNIYVWDRSKHLSVPKDEDVRAQATLKGHESEGFALEWSPFVEGQLLSGSQDRTVKLWNVKEDFKLDNKVLHAQRTFKQHSAVVNDVQFHPIHGKNLFGSVSDDLTMQLMDLRRATDSNAPVVFKNAHQDAINTLAFHPTMDKLFATGSADKTIGIFDLRWPGKKLHSLDGHLDAITKLEWHPQDTAILASTSDDRRVIFWDLSLTGTEQTPQDAEDGPPEMLFMHGGHTNRISDFTWNKNDPWVRIAFYTYTLKTPANFTPLQVACSAAEDNMIHIWRASRQIVERRPAHVKRREVDAQA